MVLDRTVGYAAQAVCSSRVRTAPWVGMASGGGGGGVLSGCKHVSRVVTDSSNDLNFEVLLEFNARGIQKGGKVLGSVGVACSVDAPQKPAAEADGNDWAVR